MNQIKGLLRETWWLWLVLFSTTLVMGLLVMRIYLLLLPGLVVVLVYFAMIRYDRDGNNVDRLRHEQQFGSDRSRRDEEGRGVEDSSAGEPPSK